MDDSEVVIMVENKQSLEEHGKIETLINQVLKNWSVPIGEDCPKICIEVFRGSCFSGFHRYFNKKWNKDKPVFQYEISFAGESGQDQAGARRDFYSGMSNFYFLETSFYYSFCLTLLWHVYAYVYMLFTAGFHCFMLEMLFQIYDGVQF